MKTNEEIIKHKKSSVEKYNSFIKNYEEQLSYFKNEYACEGFYTQLEKFIQTGGQENKNADEDVFYLI